MGREKAKEAARKSEQCLWSRVGRWSCHRCPITPAGAPPSECTRCQCWTHKHCTGHVMKSSPPARQALQPSDLCCWLRLTTPPPLPREDVSHPLPHLPQLGNVHFSKTAHCIICLKKKPKQTQSTTSLFVFVFSSFLVWVWVFSSPLFPCACRCKALPRIPAVVSGVWDAAACPTLWRRQDPAARARDGMPVHASATPHHTHLHHKHYSTVTCPVMRWSRRGVQGWQ